jgi:hypothetical protein
MSNVLTIVFDKAEQKLDSVIAAAVNELHNMGHVVKEIRVTGDSGEAKIALNQVEGIITTAADTAVADVKTDVAALTQPKDVVTAKNADGSSPVQHVAGVPDAALPEDVPTGSGPVVDDLAMTVDEKRLALLEQLDALDKEEEAAKTETAAPVETPAQVDPTNSGESVLTNSPSEVTGS